MFNEVSYWLGRGEGALFRWCLLLLETSHSEKSGVCTSFNILYMYYCFRLSDKQGAKSAESLRVLMFSWFKLFLESVVAFGDSANKVVKVVFKYFNCLKGKFLILNY